VGEISDRRARKKAQTREAVRDVARRLFAERGFESVTIADIARDADVAVQTVFNHFPTKEDLFFADRTPWVDGPAEAIRRRPDGVPPLTALRRYVVDLVESRIGTLGDSTRRCLVTTIESSPALRAKEQELVMETERKVAAALVEAWDAAPPQIPADTETTARLIAALWTTTARVLIIEKRAKVTEAGADPDDTADQLRVLGDWILGQLEFSLGVGAWLGQSAPAVPAAPSMPAGPRPVPERRPDAGWPQTVTRRAG
jgi:AcrR family transcriptional regulator